MLKAGKPRHEQISEILREQILNGELSVNDQLPSEHNLIKQFQVSRITVRRALHTLEAEGLIFRRQGLGAFVSDQRLPQGLVRLTDFVEDMARAGLEASSELINFTTEDASGEISQALQLQDGKKVCRLDRLRLADGEPIAFDVTWLPILYGQLLADNDLKNETIYRVLERDYEIPITRGRYRLAAVNATREVAQYLEIPNRNAVLLIERVSYTKNEKPVYFQRRYYRNDRVSYELELERSGNPQSEMSNGMPLREFMPVFNHDQK